MKIAVAGSEFFQRYIRVLLLTPDVPRLTVFGVRELTEMQSGRRRVSPAQTHLSVIPFLLRIPA